MTTSTKYIIAYGSPIIDFLQECSFAGPFESAEAAAAFAREEVQGGFALAQLDPPFFPGITE